MAKLSVLKRLFAYLWQDHKLKLLVAIFCVIVSNFALIAVSYALKIMLDNYILPMIQAKSLDFTNFYKFIAYLASLFLAGAIANYWYNKLLIICGLKIQKALRLTLFKHMQALPLAYFDKNPSGNIMSLYSNDIENIQSFYTQAISSLFLNSIQVLITVCIMFSMSPILTAISLGFVLIMFFVSRYIGAWSSKYFSVRQAALADLTGLIEEQFAGLRVIKTFNHEKASLAKFTQVNNYLNTCEIKATASSQTIRPIIRNLGDLQFIITAIIGCLLITKQISSLSIGSLAAYLNLSRSFTTPFMELAQLFNTIMLALAGAERIFNTLAIEPEVDQGKLEKLPENATIELRNLCFAYISGKPVLHNLNLTAKAGHKIAFVGATGAGKTTITNLLNRFYEVPAASIFYGGIDIKQFKKSALRSSLSIVLQDTNLFSGSIRENIRYGNLLASDAEVVQAARLAMADSFISHLPNGYDTIISGDMSEISEGQAQLLAIARAMLAKTPILILDEATSNIDLRTERLVQMGLDNLMQGKTVFIIAHRLSTVKNCEQIIVLDHGQVVEQGTHSELLNKHGTYHDLYTGKLEMA